MEPTSSEKPQFTMKYGEEEGGGPKKLITKGLGILALVLVGSFIWNWINSPMVVTFTGVGDVSVPATNATLSFTVNGTGATAADATTVAKLKADNIRTLLKNTGISEEDIVEAQAQVIPASSVVQGASGFQAGITMGAKTIHVTESANLVSSLYANGASLVSQPILSVENQEELEQEAFDAALKDAKKQASKIGLKNFKFIRKVVAVSQTTSPTVTTVTSKSDVPTETGEVSGGVFKIRKTLAVSFKMW